MKRIFLFLTLIPSLSFGVVPERILPKTLVIKPVSWYASQKQAWTEEVKQSSTPRAWFNYYASAVFAQSSRQELSGIISNMSTSIPDTYEYWLAKGWHDAFRLKAGTMLLVKRHTTL